MDHVTQKAMHYSAISGAGRTGGVRPGEGALPYHVSRPWLPSPAPPKTNSTDRQITREDTKTEGRKTIRGAGGLGTL